jgi:hypothetical protein
LFSDNQLACKHNTIVGHRELSAAILQGDGIGEDVKCLISGIWSLRCSASMNGVPAALSEKKSTGSDLLAFFLLMFGVAGLYRQVAH